MGQLIKFVGLVALWVLVGQAISPCGGGIVEAQDSCSSVCSSTTCCATSCYDELRGLYTDCLGAQMPCMNDCVPGGWPPNDDDEPTCCGTGVDCRCDWYGGDPAYLDGGHFYCDDGWSACCGHDQCCRDHGGFACYTWCWAAAGTYC